MKKILILAAILSLALAITLSYILLSQTLADTTIELRAGGPPAGAWELRQGSTEQAKTVIIKE